jgi:hypothetical protein
MNLWHVILLLIFSFLLSCKKDTTPSNSTPCTNCQSVNEAKDYFGFKVGTWWVYEEATSLERDSVYVTESTIDSTGYYFNVRLFSTYQDYFYHYWPTYYGNIDGCSLNGIISKRCLYVNRSKTKPGDYIGESTCFFVKFNLGDFLYTGSDLNYCPENKIHIEEIIENFNYFDTLTAKTTKIHEDCSFVDGKQPTNYFYTKHIGITRKEFIDSNQVWKLVNYHIEP